MDLNLNYDIGPSGSITTEKLQSMQGGKTCWLQASWHAEEEEEWKPEGRGESVQSGISPSSFEGGIFQKLSYLEASLTNEVDAGAGR